MSRCTRLEDFDLLNRVTFLCSTNFCLNKNAKLHGMHLIRKNRIKPNVFRYITKNRMAKRNLSRIRLTLFVIKRMSRHNSIAYRSSYFRKTMVPSFTLLSPNFSKQFSVKVPTFKRYFQKSEFTRWSAVWQCSHFLFSRNFKLNRGFEWNCWKLNREFCLKRCNVVTTTKA